MSWAGCRPEDACAALKGPSAGKAVQPAAELRHCQLGSL